MLTSAALLQSLLKTQCPFSSVYDQELKRLYLLIPRYGVLYISAVTALLLLSYETCYDVLWWLDKQSRACALTVIQRQRSLNKLLALCLWFIGPWNQVWMLLMFLHRSCEIAGILYSVYIYSRWTDADQVSFSWTFRWWCKERMAYRSRSVQSKWMACCWQTITDTCDLNSLSLTLSLYIYLSEVSHFELFVSSCFISQTRFH